MFTTISTLYCGPAQSSLYFEVDFVIVVLFGGHTVFPSIRTKLVDDTIGE